MKFPRIVPTLVMAFAPAFSAISADTNPAPTPDQLEKKQLEERVKQLEAQVRDLQGRLTDQNNNGQQLAQPDPQGQQDPFAFRGNRNARDIFEQMRREMEQHLGSMEEWDALGETPFGNNPGPNGGFSANRPRLGVDMRPVSNDLKERYKNDVKDGVFIVSIVPNTPAERAGLHVGDAVVAFAGKAIKEPQDLQEAVRSAAPGKYEISALRRGEELKLTVDLGQVEEEQATSPQGRGGWMRRGDPDNNMGVAPAPGAGNRNVRRNARTEIRASALEVNEALAQELKLNADQKKKMDDVLAKHRQGLNDDVAQRMERSNPRRGGGMNFHFGGDLGQLVEKHAKDAETELSGTLSPDQIHQWADWRKRNSSVSMNQSLSVEGGNGAAVAPDQGGF